MQDWPWFENTEVMAWVGRLGNKGPIKSYHPGSCLIRLTWKTLTTRHFGNVMGISAERTKWPSGPEEKAKAKSR